MSYESNFQMYFVQLGLEEGERRGRMKAMRDIAYKMSELDVDVDTVARYLDISPMQLRYLVNCTDWDICGTTVNACRINEPVYKRREPASNRPAESPVGDKV
ncbi:MAG: hypothetical protein ACTTJW_07495 [Sphaerochaeta sp.]